MIGLNSENEQTLDMVWNEYCVYSLGSSSWRDEEKKGWDLNSSRRDMRNKEGLYIYIGSAKAK